MKMKWIPMLTLLLLAAMITCCLGEAKCSDHPYAPVIYDDNMLGEGYEYVSAVNHRTLSEIWTCSVCHKLLKCTYATSKHRFFDGVTCWACGYSKPSKSTLREQANALIAENNIYNKQCIVIYDCSVYDRPDGARLVSLEWSEIKYVKSYQKTGSGTWILLKRTTEPDASEVGWVKAENIEIDSRTPDNDTDKWLGRVIRITTSSGRGRTSPSEDAPIKEYVHRDEEYRVLDARIGTNGKVWLQIKVDGHAVWISSGLATMEY